ncbi:hypothetical protein AYL99_00595 [Fonsecaea erecta]|uniref:Altered inheritance of mitochondria protein 9, mitochondrial n=1 Tax=Fonsecaea erecta TaxID=1367422 RepID=A0A178ZZM6_9EURO|nr:hypothetical protein AYL99_00595 [Fonsecaea erecta]OAP64623.1 hypothetical protein AYL99_00595 [Fonsecaea erecta]
MAYVRSYTTIPVPKVLDWNADEHNPIGAEYIIMEHVPGVQLHDVWPTMKSHQHMLVTKNLAYAVTEMANLTFPAYGSLYFDTTPNTQAKAISIPDGFVVGPNCGRDYWDPIDEGSHGTTLREYTDGLLDAGYARLPNRSTESDVELPYRGSVGEHVRLLQISKSAIKELIKSPLIQESSRPMLLHPDLNKRNIFVSLDDPTKITAFIDWQSTCIEPTFVYANETPDLIATPPALSWITEMDDELLAMADTSGDRERLERDIWICRQTFEVAIRGFSPKLAAARALDEALLRHFLYCHSSWQVGAVALRQELIELSQHWSQLGLPGSCSYQPSPGELAEHAKQWDDFETTQKFKLFLIRMLDSSSDG